MSVQVAKPAPKFMMDALHGEDFTKVSLEDYKGKWLVLFFYPLDFTFVCPTEIKAFSQAYEEFTKRGADILGCSVDSTHSHKAWTKDGLGKIRFPLLSDLNHTVSREYGVLDEDAGFAQRGTFIIDPDGILRWKVVHDTGIGRNIEEVLRVLDALQAGGLCAANWRAGEKLINA
ncbi:MAG TPA: peroxiredoxin [bacterium]|jgi:alkyl hydroperoxide reductase subunit AhpC